MTLLRSRVESPCGDLHLYIDVTDVSGAAIVAILFDVEPGRRDIRDGHDRSCASVGVEDHPLLARASEQLAEYFIGTRTIFDLPLRPSGTAFQRQAWNALLDIPYGSTTSYGEQARRIGKPDAVRAIGAANGRNPIGIVIPCHRVIGANGSLTGYGGGLETKAWLLRHEGAAHEAHSGGQQQLFG
jgi:methylated-DNA-[protein]-cysteine S-methyltransferase